MSLITLRYPEAIAGVEITPLWWSLVSLVHDRNFYYKDRYTFPIIGKPLLLTGTASADVAGVDVYRGSVNSYDQFQGGGRASIPSEKISSVIPEDGVYSFLLPPCAPGEVEINVIAYDSLNKEVARTRLAWVSTYWASLIWGWYVEAMWEYPGIQKVLHPWLSQDYVGVPEILSNFLPIARLPQVEWPSLDSARAVVRDALQSLYYFPISKRSLTGYTTDWLGSLTVLRDPNTWILGGTDWRFHVELPVTVGASGDAGFPLLTTLVRSGALTTEIPGTDYSVSGAGVVTVTASGNVYPGSYPLFEVDVLSFDFQVGDWIGVAEYSTGWTSAWTDSSPSLDTPTKITAVVSGPSSTQWAIAVGDRDATAQNIVTAWNSTLEPLYFLHATYLGVPGRILISGVAGGSSLDDYKKFEVLKGGPNPILTPIKVSRAKPINLSGPDTISVNALGNGAISDYHALFLGKEGSPQRHILEGTIAGVGESHPYKNLGSVVSMSYEWLNEASLIEWDIPFSSILQDTDGQVTGTSGDWYVRLPSPLFSLSSYSLNLVTPVVVPPDVLDLGAATPDSSVPYSVSYYPLPVELLDKAISRITPSFFTPQTRIDQPWVGPSTLDTTWYSGALTAFGSGGAWVDTAVGLSESNDTWTVEKATALIQDSSCYESFQYVPSGVFEVGDTVVVGRDQVSITSIETLQYVGDKLTYDQILQESHYAGEEIYVPDSELTRSLQSVVLDLLFPGIPFPPGKRILLDIVDSLFGDTYKQVQIRRASSPSGTWTDWENFDPPMQILPAPLDAMAGPTSMGPEYKLWKVSEGGSGAYSVTPLYGAANSVPGLYPSGCIQITGSSVNTAYGVEKTFPRGCRLSSPTLSFWVRSTGSGTAYIDFSTSVPMGSLEGSSTLTYSIPWTLPASGSTWVQTNVDVSSIPEADLLQIRTIRFRSSVAGSMDISMLYPSEFFQYFQIKIQVYNAHSRVDYVLSRVGVRTEVDTAYPSWPIVQL